MTHSAPIVSDSEVGPNLGLYSYPKYRRYWALHMSLKHCSEGHDTPSRSSKIIINISDENSARNGAGWMPCRSICRPAIVLRLIGTFTLDPN